MTGNIAKYTLNSNIQADTTDNFTYTAIDGNPGGVSNIGTVTLKITVQSQDPGVDKFGIKKIYPTKSVGGKTEKWDMNMDNPTNDARTSPPSMTKNSDGSWKVTSGQGTVWSLYFNRISSRPDLYAQPGTNGSERIHAIT